MRLISSVCLRNELKESPALCQGWLDGCFWPQFSYRFTKASVQKATRWCRCPSQSHPAHRWPIPPRGSEDGALTRDSPRDGPQVQPPGSRKPLSPRAKLTSRLAHVAGRDSQAWTPRGGGEGWPRSGHGGENREHPSAWLSLAVPRSLLSKVSLGRLTPFHDCCQMVPKSRIEELQAKAWDVGGTGSGMGKGSGGGQESQGTRHLSRVSSSHPEVEYPTPGPELVSPS